MEAGQAPAGGWQIQVSEDSGATLDDSEESVGIYGGGVATSSTTVRRWTRDGVVLHHIIDPATGLPVDGPWRTATVDAAIVKGEQAIGWLEGHRLSARLVDQNGRIHRTRAWPTPANSKLRPTVF